MLEKMHQRENDFIYGFSHVLFLCFIFQNTYKYTQEIQVYDAEKVEAYLESAFATYL